MDNLQRCCQTLHHPVNETGSPLKKRGRKCKRDDRYFFGDTEVSEIRKRGEVADNDDFTSRQASMKNMDDWSNSCGVQICDIHDSIFSSSDTTVYRVAFLIYFPTSTHRKMKTTQRVWYHMKKLAKVKNFGWKFKRSIRGRFQKNCEFQKWLHETPKGKCWNISHGTVLKICPYKPSAMI